MLIRIKQIRMLADRKTHGTDVVLGKGKEKVTLQFRPIDAATPDENHVCDVKDKAHVAQLLAIPEGFEVHDSELERAAPAAAAAAAAATGTSTAAPKAEDKAAEKTADKAADKAGKSPDDMTKAELVKAVTAKTGKKPHPSTSEAKLRQILAGE